MDSLPVKYLSLIILLIAALKNTKSVQIPDTHCANNKPLENNTTPMVTLMSKYENCSTQTNKTTYYLSKEEKGVVLTCQSQVPNRWVWNMVDDYVKTVIVEKERLKINNVTVFSSKLIVYFADIIESPDHFNFSCTNEIEYKDGPYSTTCVTVHQTVENETNSLGPFKLSVLENIDSLRKCIKNGRTSRFNCPVNLVVDMSNITGICTSEGEPKSRMCADLDHCKSLIYINAKNETCDAILQTFNETSKHQKSLINHPNHPQIAICQVPFDSYPSWPSFLLLYPSFGKREWKKFDHYASMTDALGNNSIQLFALSHNNINGNQTIRTSGRNEFAENENVEFFCRAIWFLYMKGFRIRLGTGDSNGTVIEGQMQNHTTIDKNDRFYNFSQNVSLSSEKYGNISWISCDGPVWNSLDWFSSTINISIYRMTSTAEKPYVKLNCTVDKNFTTFVCTYGGWPRPNVAWTFSELVEFIYESGHLPDAESYNMTWSQTKTIRNPKTSFNVTCAVENFIGIGSSSQFIPIKGLAESKVVTVVSIAVAVAGIVIIAVVFFIMHRRYRKKLALYNPNQQLTEAEIEGFYNGETGSRTVNYEALELPYNNDYEIKQKDLELDGSILGSGQFGIVLKGNIGPLTVAVKTVKPTADIIYLKSLLSELKILQYVGVHPNIVNLIGADTTNIKKREVLLVLDYCSNGSLLSFLRQSRERFVDFFGDSGSQAERKQWPLYENSGGIPISTLHLLALAYEIASAMDHLARKNVIHGDLAARNVLVTGDFHAKVCDFGLAKQLLHYSVYVQKVNFPLPLRWMAIESLQDLEFSLASDRWSYGVCLWEIFSLAEIPYPGEQWSFESYKMLQEGYRMAKPTFANNSIYRLMLQCWDAQPESRPSFQYVVNELRKEENSLN